MTEHLEPTIPDAPPDVQEWGIRHGIPEFAAATWRAGYADALRTMRRRAPVAGGAPRRVPSVEEIEQAIKNFCRSLPIRELPTRHAVQSVASKIHRLMEGER